MPERRPSQCPHCGKSLASVWLPETLYEHEWHLVCFNDECPYYVRGWAWMEQQYGVRTSYRYRVERDNGHASPLPVWSPTALRGSIVADPTPADGLEERP